MNFSPGFDPYRERQEAVYDDITGLDGVFQPWNEPLMIQPKFCVREAPSWQRIAATLRSERITVLEGRGEGPVKPLEIEKFARNALTRRGIGRIRRGNLGDEKVEEFCIQAWVSTTISLSPPESTVRVVQQAGHKQL